MILIKIKMAMIPKTFVEQMEDSEAHQYITEILRDGFTVEHGNPDKHLFYPPRAILSIETEKGFTGNINNPSFNNDKTQRIKRVGRVKIDA